MERRASKPRRVSHSESLDRLQRLKRDFAVVPYATDPKQRKKKHSKKKEQNEDEQKKLIRDVDKSVKGLEFSAAEIAQVIRSWMKQDEDR